MLSGRYKLDIFEMFLNSQLRRIQYSLHFKKELLFEINRGFTSKSLVSQAGSLAQW